MASNKVPKSFTPDIEAFIASFAADIRDGAAAIFAGAGLSVESGFVNWSALLRDIAHELGLDVDRETNLVAVAQYHLNERRNRSRINQKIVDEFSAGHSINENHEILARLPITTYWTTNYDAMLETALATTGKIVDVKHSVPQLKTVRRGRSVTLYKMHGDASDPDNAVLTKDDYEGYFRDREPFVAALSGDLVAKTMLFLGFSFTDPNIDYVLSRVRVVLRSAPKQHYCILRREQRRTGEKVENFRYRQRQQDYFVKDLARVGIHALMIDEYGDVKRILRAVEERYRSRSVFIAGSAAEFDPWETDTANRFLESLAKALIGKGMDIVTGFGLGVGPPIIAGAYGEILLHPGARSLSQLQAHPFPADTGTAPARLALYQQHRERMIGAAGVIVLVFGNKREGSGALVPADGMRAELEIAQAMGLHVIAAGATGWVANEIAATLSPPPGATESYRKAFLAANSAKSKPEQIVRAIVTMIEEFAKLTTARGLPPAKQGK